MKFLVLATLVGCAAGGGLTVTAYDNVVRAGTGKASVQPGPIFSSPANGDKPGSVEVRGTITFPQAGWWTFDCLWDGRTTEGLVWIDGHQICHDGTLVKRTSTDHQGDTDNPLQVQNFGVGNLTKPVRIHFSSSDGNVAAVGLRWGFGSENVVLAEIPSSAFSPDLPAAEQKRDSVQRALLNGWGVYNSFNIMEFAKLPDSMSLKFQICNNANQCITDTRIDPTRTNDKLVRVGQYATDRSYAQYYVTDKPPFAANISVEFASVGDDLLLMLTPAEGTDPNSYKNYTYKVSAKGVWLRPAALSFSQQSITMQSPGLPSITATATIAGKTAGDGQSILFPVGPIGFSTSKKYNTTDAIRNFLDNAKALHDNKMLTRFGGKKELAIAVEASVMWNVIYSPFEQGLIIPVSRSWNFVPNQASSDLQYVLFDWDGIFGSLIMATTDKNLAYSNLIQVIKSMTSQGFVPNYCAAGYKTEDRSEPPIGAKTLLQLYKKFGDLWIVDLLFEDLVRWNEFSLRARGLDGYVVLGSYNNRKRLFKLSSSDDNNWSLGRLESGMDNSPMYDDTSLYNLTSHRMMLYDVGMTSMAAMEAEALAELAKLLGRSDEEKTMQQRLATWKSLLAKLWDSDAEIFINMRASNKSFYERVSPTSFYPMQTGVPTVQQAEVMLQKWMLSADHFCIGNTTSSCYWGLPSIEASDSAFPAQGYWRGFVWGPNYHLVYWGMQRYDQSFFLNYTRQALVDAGEKMMMSQWNRNRHICENFSPHKDATDCTGTMFYHWGALAGLISLEELGLW